MDRELRSTHFHVRWTKKAVFDWRPFETGHEALEHALQFARPAELFSIEEVLSTHCTMCRAKAATGD
jgi:hypothetical protein